MYCAVNSRTERKRAIKEQALYGLEDMKFRLMV
jgi:hypothetical protein